MESGNVTIAEKTTNEIINNQARMVLLTRLDLKKIFDSAPWVAKVLRRFSHVVPEEGGSTSAQGVFAKLDLMASVPSNNFIKVLLECEGAGKLQLTEVERRLFELHKENLSAESPADVIAIEKKDYDQWCETLRVVGRAICTGWPVYDEAPFEKAHTSDIEGKILDLLRLDVSGAQIGDDQQAHFRQARNFVFLLYGLAPSLPAIIHTEMMAEILHLWFRGEPQKIKIAIGRELKAWIEFIGALSVTLRYVKIQCMFLFSKLFLRYLDGEPGAVRNVVGIRNGVFRVT